MPSLIEGPVVVVVMDGVGIGSGDASDAVHAAYTPTLDWLRQHTPSTTLLAHGKAVGLPSDEDMGNSEVGHNALGAGRIYDQGAKLVVNAIRSGDLFRGPVWQEMIARTTSLKHTLHFIGLLSDGNVHSHIEHLFAMLVEARRMGVRSVCVHALLDGRDVSETSALVYVEALEKLLVELSTDGHHFRVASGGGRMQITMDRYEADWAMVERGFQLHVHAQGRRFSSLRQAVEVLREETPGIIDQNLSGFVIEDAHGNVSRMQDGDAVILFNFRGDRAIEISRALCEGSAFDQKFFDRGGLPDIYFAGMMQYDGDLKIPEHHLVSPPHIDNTLSERLAELGKRQLALSETQKFGHVTYFWNGNRSLPFAGETWIEVPGDNLPFEERPWMKAAEITDRAISELMRGIYEHARINYPNGDMVGHTGKYNATVLAVEAVDLQLARLLPVIEKLRGALLVTADHGNADEMYEHDKKGALIRGVAGALKAKTSHTLNRVPFSIYAPSVELSLANFSGAGLSNIAATVADCMGVSSADFDRSLLRL